MIRVLLIATLSSMVVAAATALGSPRSGGQTAVVRSEQARGAEALMDLLEQRELGLNRFKSSFFLMFFS